MSKIHEEYLQNGRHPLFEKAAKRLSTTQFEILLKLDPRWRCLKSPSFPVSIAIRTIPYRSSVEIDILCLLCKEMGFRQPKGVKY